MFKKTALLAMALAVATAFQPVPKAHAMSDGAAAGIGLAAGLIGAAIAANAAAKQQACEQWLPIVNDMRYDDGTRAYAAQIVAGCGISAPLMARPAPAPVYAAPAGQPIPLMSAPAPIQQGGYEIPLEGMQAGRPMVTVVLNNAGKLRMLLDTGATITSIPKNVARQLVEMGRLTIEDLRQPAEITVADGTSFRSLTAIVSVTFAGRTANVRAVIAPAGATPLLGTDFLKHFGTYTVDNRRKVLVMTQ
jgi:predicted aspartyl protease